MGDSQRRRRTAVGRKHGLSWSQLYAIAIVAVAAGVLAIVAVVIGAVARDGGNGAALVTGSSPTGTVQSQAAGEDTPTGTETPPPATKEPTEDEPATVACGDVLAPLDKQHRLDADCAPGDLVELPSGSVQGTQRMRRESADALMELFDAAQRDGFRLYAVSGYRSYEDQVAAYEENRRIYGDDADRFSARPGHSEHQLGTAVDVSSERAGYQLEPFEGTPEAEWVGANSWRYGFIVSYPSGNEEVTGYAYEPWHIRYVGKETAAKVRQSGVTLHEYLLGAR